MRRYLPDLRSNRIESHHQEMVLFSREFCRFLPAPWPGEAPGFKALIEEKKAVAFPEEPFDAVAPPAAEKKEDILFRGIQVIIRKYQLRQALDSFPKIGVACCVPASFTDENGIRHINVLDFLLGKETIF